jgi:quercetin dioxygenase-like cupin family protein
VLARSPIRTWYRSLLSVVIPSEGKPPGVKRDPMSDIQNNGTHVPPGEGKSVWLVGDLITVKLEGEDAGGAYSLVEEMTPTEDGPPPHIHHDAGETIYVLEGELEFMVGGNTISANTGAAVNTPRGTLHTFRKVGMSPSRRLTIISPGGSRDSSSRRANRQRRATLRLRASRT